MKLEVEVNKEIEKQSRAATLKIYQKLGLISLHLVQLQVIMRDKTSAQQYYFPSPSFSTSFSSPPN